MSVSIYSLFVRILMNSASPLSRPPQLPCGHEYCKSCLEELRQKGVDKSCPLCRKPLPPGPDKLFDLGHGMYMKIKGAIDRSRPRVDVTTPWPALSDEQRCEMDQAVAMLREAANQGHMEAQAHCGDLYKFGRGVAQDDRLALLRGLLSMRNKAMLGANPTQVFSTALVEAASRAMSERWSGLRRVHFRKT